MKSRYKIGFMLILVLLLSAGGTALTSAQMQDAQWTEPYRLSTTNSSASEAVMATDQYGYVHTFWVETASGDTRSTIEYARFDGATWTTPLDIYVSDPGVVIDRLATATDQRGVLHLAWTVGGGYRSRPIYYSQAPAHSTLSAKHWQTPTRIDVSAHLIQLKTDPQGILHVVYSKFFEPEAGIYYLRSEDQGVSWTAPVWLDPDIASGYGPATLQLALDDSGGLHVIWNYVVVDYGETDWVRYAHSLDRGATWSEPITIDKNEPAENITLRAPGPIITAVGETIYVMWAAGELNYRNFRFSTDAGQSWSAPQRIFGNLNGQAQDDFAIDSAGRVHFLGQIRFPQGLYHAYWEQDHWTEPSLLYLMRHNSEEVVGDRLNVHRVEAVIRTGNQLVTTFYDRDEEPPIAHVLYGMHRTLDDVVAVPPVPTPMLTPTPTATPRPSPTLPPLVPTPTPTIGAIDSDTEGSTETIGTTNSPTGGLMWGIVPALLLVAGTTVFHLWRRP